jgi:hypothetical protein
MLAEEEREEERGEPISLAGVGVGVVEWGVLVLVLVLESVVFGVVVESVVGGMGVRLDIFW